MRQHLLLGSDVQLSDFPGIRPADLGIQNQPEKTIKYP